jgi:hypothetical protein
MNCWKDAATVERKRGTRKKSGRSRGKRGAHISKETGDLKSHRICAIWEGSLLLRVFDLVQAKLGQMRGPLFAWRGTSCIPSQF